MFALFFALKFKLSLIQQNLFALFEAPSNIWKSVSSSVSVSKLHLQLVSFEQFLSLTNKRQSINRSFGHVLRVVRQYKS